MQHQILTLSQVQEDAVRKMTMLLAKKRNTGFTIKARRTVYRGYVDAVTKEFGFSTVQAERQWQNILDVARLNLASMIDQD